eukprot:10411671-Lingulodinium_polyedra.AAC.1
MAWLLLGLEWRPAGALRGRSFEAPPARRGGRGALPAAAGRGPPSSPGASPRAGAGQGPGGALAEF